MAELQRATEQLQAALDRLEQVIDGKPAPRGDAEMRSALAQARREHAALREAARKVAERLDGTIERLKSVL